MRRKPIRTRIVGREPLRDVGEAADEQAGEQDVLRIGLVREPPQRTIAEIAPAMPPRPSISPVIEAGFFAALTRCCTKSGTIGATDWFAVCSSIGTAIRTSSSLLFRWPASS